MSARRPIRAVDLFCGAGGTSTGLALAVQAMGGVPGRDLQLLGINHWQVAVASHAQSHPWAQHLCERVEAVDRSSVFPGARLDLLVASPECTHFSVARGGKPVEDQKRAGAWYVLDWIGDRRPSAVLLENVPEFAHWGRLERGKAVKASEGSIFKAWLGALRALGYNVDWRVLNTADYGAATTRRRLYVIAKRGRKPLHWPVATHSKGGKASGTAPWRAAREILDFTLPSQSIFGRKRPLAQRTLDRVAKGIRAGTHGRMLEPLARAVERCSAPVPLVDLLGPDGLAELESWTLGQHGGAIARSSREPMATIAGGGAVRLIEALLVQSGGPARSAEPRDLARPMPTLLSREHFALAEFLVHLKGTGGPRPSGEPVPSLMAGGEHVALAEPVIVSTDRPVTNRSLPRSPDEPLPTVTGNPRIAVAQPSFILPPQGRQGGRLANKARPVDEDPVQTLTQRGGGHLVEPGTVSGSGAGSLAYLASYYGRGDAASVEEPVGALTTHDRYALVEVFLRDCLVDVRLRMLHPKELAAAMGFPPEYQFTGTRTQVVKQIGNAVEVNVARALCTALLTNAPSHVLDVVSDELPPALAESAPEGA